LSGLAASEANGFVATLVSMTKKTQDVSLSSAGAIVSVVLYTRPHACASFGWRRM
jgi:hypothetical protein